jgi:hypothetical protein
MPGLVGRDSEAAKLLFIETLAHSKNARRLIARFDRLTPDARLAAEAAAILGTEFGLAQAARLANSDIGMDVVLRGLRIHGAAAW